MKKVAFILVFLLTTFAVSFAQTSADTITIKKTNGGYKFYQADRLMTLNELMATLRANGDAYQQIKAAKTSSDLSLIFGGVGGFMIGWQLGAAIRGEKPNTNFLGIGAALIVISIPLLSSSVSQAVQAVNTYNRRSNRAMFWDKHDLKLSIHDNGIGLALNF